MTLPRMRRTKGGMTPQEIAPLAFWPQEPEANGAPWGPAAPGAVRSLPEQHASALEVGL